MKVESLDTKWNVMSLDSAAAASINLPGINRFASIEHQLYTFLTEQIEQWEPDLIIVVERKGTAILRTLKESSEFKLNWPWKNVISSESIDQVSDDYFHSKRILIFDDMMKTAGHIKDVLNSLARRSLYYEGNIRVAVFAVHEDCPAELNFSGGAIPYVWFYRHLTSVSYRSIQIQIVNMLQRAGSLMLDTEHIEVRLRLRSNLNRLYNALRRKSDAYVFHSSDQRLNITVFYEDDQAHTLPEGLFPRGTCFSGIVKKCRFVDRGGGEYAIIPICFPSILETSEEWPVNKAEVELLGEGTLKKNIARFNGVGLLAALEVLRWVLKDLALLDPSDYIISLPKSTSDKESKGGYTLEHLKVVFPTLDIDKLTDRITQIDKESSSEGAQLRAKKFEPAAPPEVTDDELHQDALRLLQIMLHELDQRRLEKELLRDGSTDDQETDHFCGLRADEIFKLGERMRWGKARTSTLCDILIDQAALSTDISSSEDKDGIMRIVRTFAPAGEVVSEMVRRYSTQWGLPYGF